MIPEACAAAAAWRSSGGESGVAATRLLARRECACTRATRRTIPTGATRSAGCGPLSGVTLGRRAARFRGSVPRGGDRPPGVPPEAPPLAAAREARVPILSEIDLGFQRAAGSGTAASRSRGRTARRPPRLGGASPGAAGMQGGGGGKHRATAGGHALEGDHYQWLAVEVSSFQLHDSPPLRPGYRIVTNLAPDPPRSLRQHGGVLLRTSGCSFRNSAPPTLWVLNGDDRRCSSSPKERRAVARCSRCSAPPTGGTTATGSASAAGTGGTACARGARAPGAKRANALAAALAVQEPASRRVIGEGCASFRSLPHRSSRSRVAGVRWINDSKGHEHRVDRGRDRSDGSAVRAAARRPGTRGSPTRGWRRCSRAAAGW